MSLKKNIAANYVSLIYTTVIGILILPVLHELLGSEAFGLIGFYTTMQFWFVLMDFGLSATLSRECSRYSGGVLSESQLISTIKSIEFIFRIFAAFGIAVIFLSADYISSSWLSLENLPSEDVSLAIQLMAVSIALRWMSGLYRGVLNGFERQVWTGWFAIFIATLRYPLSIYFIKYIDASPVAYFTYQIAVSLLEYFLVKAKSKSQFNKSAYSDSILAVSNIRNLIAISLSISAVGIITTSLTQVDKISLSRILPLGDFGDFTLMSMLASGIILLGGPFSAAVIPRMSKLVAEQNYVQLISTYKIISMLAGVAVFSAASFIYFFAYEVLYVWTGNADYSDKMSLAFGLYAIANALFVVASFPHYLQYAYGDLRLQVGILLVALAIFIPISVLMSIKFGVIGAASSWLTLNILLCIFGTAVVHAKFMAGQHVSWLLKCIIPAMAFSLLGCFLIDFMIVWSESKIILGLQLALSAIFVLLVSALPLMKTMSYYFLKRTESEKPDELVVLSRSVGFEVISERKICTSSQLYEVDLIESLAKNVNVRVECVSGKHDSHVIDITNNLSFINRGKLSLLGSLGLMSYLVSNRYRKNLKVLTTGYYPVEMMILILARIIDIKSYSIVFDTHLTATNKMPFIKKIVSNFYYGIGFIFLRALNGIIVLNNAFLVNKKINIRTLISRIGFSGVDTDYAMKLYKSCRKRPVVVFAGTLNPDNGIDLILETITKNKDLEVKFNFYGYGEKSRDVEELAKIDGRVEFMGVVLDDVLNEVIQDSDYLICLRNPESISCEYSFPSKLIKFMGSGVPVIANDFPGLRDDYKNHLVLTDYSISGLNETIRKLGNDEAYRIVGPDAARFIQNTHNWSNISYEMYEFIFSTNTGHNSGGVVNAAT